MDVSDAIHPDQRVCSRQDHRSRGWINPRIGCHSWIFCRLVKHLRASIHGSASRDERYPFCCKEADGFAAPTASSSSSDVAARDAATKACGRFTKCPRKRSRSKPWSQAEGCATRLFLQANGLDWLAMAPKAKARQIILLREQIAVSVLRYCLPSEPMTGRSAIGRRTKREIRVRMISG